MDISTSTIDLMAPNSNVVYWNTASTTSNISPLVVYQTVVEEHSITEDILTVRNLTPFVIHQVRQIVKFQISGEFTRIKTTVQLDGKFIGSHYSIDPLTDDFINKEYEKDAVAWLEKTMTPDKSSKVKR